MSDDIPFDKTFDLEPDQVQEVAPRRARDRRQQSGPVHLQGHDELHRRPRQSRDPRSRPRRRCAYRGAARRRARRNRHAYFRHPYPSRSFARGAQGQGGDRRQSFRAGPAPAGAAAPYRRNAPARCLGRHGFPSRRRARRRRGGERRRLDAGSGDDAGPHRQPHGLCVQGGRSAVLRRPCHGVVDHDRGAARRRHERLHGVAAKAGAAQRAALSARPRRAGARRAALRRSI